jgi:hemerythrin
MQFLWDDSYNIGNKKIDAQHRFVFELAEKMINANTKSELIKYFMMLYQHIGEHFKEEENLLAEHNHPNYQHHVNCHNKMLDNLVDISNKINNDSWNKTDIERFMYAWATEHILIEDRELEERITH